MQNKLILGTVQFGLLYGINNQVGLISEKEVNHILKRASSLGINTLDTASGYGDAEKRIGEFHKNHQPFKVITKFSKIEGENWKTSLQLSLNKLKIESVETVMFHSYQAFLENRIYINQIVKTSKGKLFKKLGVSIYNNEELKALIEFDEIDVIQLPFNLLDNHQQRGVILKEAQFAGKEVHSRSCFLQGLFFKDENTLPDNLKPLKPWLRQIKNIALEHTLETGHLALQYVLNKNYIDGVLFGVDSIQQLEQNFIWANEKIPEEIFVQIDNIKVADPHLLNPSKW